MPRRGRLHIAGGCYHVMGRGLERRNIFGRKEDKEDFLERLEKGLGETGIRCFAWSLMSNHYHLLVQVNSESLSCLMSSLLGGYAGAFNRRRKRVGYVFQTRYKSVLCDEENYLLELVRYIHLNPVKAKVLRTSADLDYYDWTGHSSLMGNKERNWTDHDEVLSRFSSRRTTARKRYREFVLGYSSGTSELDLSGGGLIRSYGGWENVKSFRKDHEQRIGDERILGDSSFVKESLKQDEIDLKQDKLIEGVGLNIERLIKAVCKLCGLDETDILTKGRGNDVSRAKSLICYFANQHLKISTQVIADRLEISQPAVSYLKKKGKIIVSDEEVSVSDIIECNLR